MTRSVFGLVIYDLVNIMDYNTLQLNKLFEDDIAVVCSDQSSGVVFVVRLTLSVFSGPEVVTFPPQTHFVEMSRIVTYFQSLHSQISL